MCNRASAKRNGHTLLREPQEAIPHEELGATFTAIAALMIQFQDRASVTKLLIMLVLLRGIEPRTY